MEDMEEKQSDLHNSGTAEETGLGLKTGGYIKSGLPGPTPAWQSQISSFPIPREDIEYTVSRPGVPNLLVSLCHTGRRRVVLGHTLNTLQHVIPKEAIMF